MGTATYYLYYCGLARIGGRRKVTYPLDHNFSVDSKKLNFVLIAMIDIHGDTGQF
jgi:hypothetical protein